MGHGASTNVKKFTVSQGSNRVTKSRQSSARCTQADGDGDDPGPCAPSPVKPGWTRSSSDGCIVENLNTSKTKAELLEQQVDEYKELFRHAEERAEEAQARAKRIEEQMAEVEGTNFELLDRVSDLEQQLEEAKDQVSPDVEREFSQILLERDQLIEKQEQQVKSLGEELAKMRIKLKKKLRSVQTELAEVKQEAGLKMYSHKDQIATLQDENTQLRERLDRAHSNSNALSRQSSAANATPTGSLMKKDTPPEEEWEDGRTRVILDLSGQLSSQEVRIGELEELVRERDRTIGAQQQQSRTHHPRPPSGSQRAQGGTSSRSGSAEKRGKLPQGDDSLKGWTAEDDGTHPSSARRRKPSSSKRSSSARSQTSSDIKHDEQVTDSPAGDDVDSLSNHKIGSAWGNRSRVRQPSANSVDSAISDHSDAGSGKASSASSSRERRRLKNQLSRQSSAERKGSGTEFAKAQTGVEGRDSGIGVSGDAKSKYNEDMEQMMQAIIGDS